jgi:hypothetical protein
VSMVSLGGPHPASHKSARTPKTGGSVGMTANEYIPAGAVLVAGEGRKRRKVQRGKRGRGEGHPPRAATNKRE